MEFTLECENIQILIRNVPKVNTSAKHLIINNEFDNIEEYQENIDSSEFITAEVLIKLNNFFLINNIKLSGEIDEFCVKSIEYQNIKTGLWEVIPYYNPDKEETVIKDNDSLSIFCVGLTQFLKINLVSQGFNLTDRTLNTQIEHKRLKKIINNDLINASSNQSMQDQIGRNLNISSSLPKNTCSILKLSGEIENEIYVNHIKNLIKKISIFAQYIYSLPNSTYLLTLLNISNYFLINNFTENYLLSIYLTASSMTQARLFIQAWELFNKIQFTIINNKNQLFLIKYLFDSNTHSLIASDDNKMSYFLAKIEILKAVCMYEYGQINSFMESQKNSLNFFYKNDFSTLKSSISWCKHTEINYNKFYIQNYLSRYTNQLIEFLFILLKDKSEIVILYSLKTMEFLIDYCIHNVSQYIPKLIKIFFKLLSPLKKTKLINDFSSDDLINNILIFKENFLCKGVYFPETLLDKYLNENDKNKLIVNDKSLNDDNMNPILMKQINYTFDTLINNIEALSSEDLIKIMNSNQILEMLSYNSDSITKINIMKFIKKVIETIRNKIKFTPELLIKIYDKGLDLSFSNVKTIINFNNNFSANHKSNNFQIKKFNILDFHFLENNEFGELITMISELLAEEKFLFSNCQGKLCSNVDTKDIITWISDSLEILFVIINDPSMNIKTEIQKQLIEFAQYYAIFLFYLLEIIFLNKIDFKSEIYEILVNNLKVVVANNIEKLLNVTIKYEEVSLTNRDLFIFFEISISIFTKIKTVFQNVLDFNFYYIFIPQYVHLMTVIQKSGIFNENLLYLIRTLPLLDGEHFYNDENIMIIKKLFSVILTKFPNFFNEEIFVLFNLFLDKIDKYLDEELINGIILAFNHKYTYKGSNLIKSKLKFFEVIYGNNNYCNILIKIVTFSLNRFLDNFIKFNGIISSFKDNFIEFIDKFEFFIKFIDFIKNKEDIVFSNNDSIKILLINNISIKIFIELGRCLEENVISKINEYSNVFLDLFLKLFEKTYKTTNDKEYKFFKSFNLVIYHNIYLITSYIFFLLDNSRSVYLISDNIKILTKISKHLKEFNELTDKISNQSKEEEDLYKDLQKKILESQSQSDFHKEKEFFDNSELFAVKSESNSDEMVFNLDDKLNTILLFKVFWIKTSNLKEIHIKLLLNEYTHLIDVFVSQNIVKSILNKKSSSDNVVEHHSSFVISIILYFLNINEEAYNMFSLELIMKYFNLKFENTLYTNIEQVKLKEKYNFPLNIWEKVFNLIDDKSFKISLYSHFIIQIASPKDEMHNFVKIRCEKLIFNERNKIALNNNENSLIKFKIITKELSIDKLISLFWLNEEEMNKIHITIKDKLLIDNNLKANNQHADHNFPTIPSKTDKNDNNNFNNDDEYLDLIKIPELINICDDIEESIYIINQEKIENYQYEPRTIIQKRTSQSNYEEFKSLDKKQKNIVNNYYLNNNVQNLNNLKHLKDDNVSLEELGVFEAEDEIFDNFDEENIPVIKNVYKRKKGSAEKLKTNQNTRNLFMSNNNVPNNNNSNLVITANIITNQNKLLTNNNLNSVPQSMTNNFIGNTSNNIVSKPTPHSNFYSKLLSSPKEINKNVINIENLDQLDTDQLPDLQSKKKNIRPQNGLRPATPPIKPISKSGNKNHYSNINYNANINNIIKEQVSKTKLTENRRNNNIMTKGVIDKKYEIKSMEELFIEDDPKNKEIIYEIGNSHDQNNNFEEDERLTKFNEYLYVDENNNLQKNTYNHVENVDFENIMEKYGEFYQENFVNKNNNNDVESVAESLPMAEDYVGEEVYENDNSEEYIDKKTKIDVLREAKSKRPPTRYGNREDQVLWSKFSSKQNNLNLDDLIQSNSANRINKSNRYTNNLNMNNTFNQTNKNYLENKTVSSPQEKNRSSQNLQTYLKASPPHIIPDNFRKNIQLKLSKNSNKIIENLRRLSEVKSNNPPNKKSFSSMTSRIEEYDSPYSDMNLNTFNNHSDLFHRSSISSSNAVILDHKSKSPELKNNINDDVMNSQAKHSKIKYNSFINTNIPDANTKYFLGSSTKTPSFNCFNNKDENFQK